MELYETYVEENNSFEFVKASSKNRKKHFVSTFIKILDGAYIITFPTDGKERCKIKAGEKAFLNIYTTEGIFNLPTQVVQIADECIKVRLIDTVVLSQRRQYARVDIMVPMRIKVDLDRKTNVYDVVTKNMCAQGVSFELNSPLDGFGKTQVKFMVKNRLIQTFCALAYCNKIYSAQNEEEQDIYSCGLHFTSINQLNANFLAKECFSYEMYKKKEKYDAQMRPDKEKEPQVTIDIDGKMVL